MQFLISMVFVGMLALSSQASAGRIDKTLSEKILINGEVVAERWNSDIHNTRVIYKNRYYECLSFVTTGTLNIMCTNSD